MVAKSTEIRRPSAGDHLLVTASILVLFLVAPTLFTTSALVPSAGVVLAASLLFGPWALPGIALGTFLGVVAHFLQTDAPAWTSANLAANGLEVTGVLLAGWSSWALLGRGQNLGEALADPRWVMGRLLPGAVLFGVLCVTPAALWYGGAGPGGAGGPAVAVGWAAGHFVGALVVAPVFLTFWIVGLPRRPWEELVPHTAAGVILAVLLLGIFGPWTDLVPPFLRQPSFLLVPLAVVALTRGPSTSFFFLAMTMVFAQASTLAGLGPFASLETAGPPGGFTAWAGVSALVVLFGQAVLSSQRRQLEIRSEDLRQNTLILEHRVEARTRELTETNRRFDSLALSDGVTKLANRKRFDQTLVRERSRHSRSGKDLSLILLDLDRFKSFTELVGPAESEACLKRVARILLEAAVRPADLAARFGGGRFAVLLPETDGNGALVIATKLLGEIRTMGIAHPGSDVAPTVTASLGVVTVRCRRDDAPDSLLALAEVQLHRAKAAGRNQTAS